MPVKPADVAAAPGESVVTPPVVEPSSPDTVVGAYFVSLPKVLAAPFAALLCNCPPPADDASPRSWVSMDGVSPLPPPELPFPPVSM